MLKTIVIVVAVVVGVVILSIAVVLVLIKRGKARASVIATIHIEPSGKPAVEFAPCSGIDDLKLMKLALLYAAKIRWVLREEDPQVGEAYENLMQEIADPFGLSEDDDFLLRLSEIMGSVETPIDAPKASAGGERFTIRLVEGRVTDFINNDLPYRGLVVNIPLSVGLLINGVATGIERCNLLLFRKALDNLYPAIFNENEAGLFAIGKAALVSLEEARAELRE